MSVSDGSPVNAAYTNSKLMSRTVDTGTVGKMDLQNSDPVSGSDVINVQREINSNNSFSGRISGSAKDVKPVWTNNDVGASTDDLKTRADVLTGALNDTTGHAHDNTPGSGAPIDASNLDNINLFFGELQTTTFDSAAGTTDDVSASFSGKISGGGVAALGIPTSPPNNRCEIRSKSNGEQIEDTNGQKVYARITEAAGVWTLSYYTNEAGTETAHSLSTQDIRIYFTEVFDQFTRPTFPVDAGIIGSLDLTADIVDATASQRGLVSTGTQSFAGAKTHTGDQILQAKLRGDVATDSTTTGANATLPAPSKTHLRITNGSLASIDMISGPAATQFFVLTNKTGNDITISDELGGTAANRILTGTGDDLTLMADASLWLLYDSTSTRWIVVGGSGGGTAGTCGSEPIADTSDTVSVTFLSDLGTTAYSVVATAVNETDADPMFIPVAITDKLSTGFTAKWNVGVDSANYVLDWVVQLHP